MRRSKFHSAKGIDQRNIFEYMMHSISALNNVAVSIAMTYLYVFAIEVFIFRFVIALGISVSISIMLVILAVEFCLDYNEPYTYFEMVFVQLILCI